MNKKWEYYETDTELSKKIAAQFNVSELLATILVHRGITEKSEIEIFLNPKRSDFYDPFLMPDMEKAVERICHAIEQQEKVLIYGDYDVDGITSITVLKKFLQDRGLETDYYIPNRLEEGYGLNKESLQQLAKKEYTLIITVDCGISGVEEVELCNNLGIRDDYHRPP